MKKLPLLYCDHREDGETTLRQSQLVEVHLLRVFDKICRDNGLRYWLAFGTLLGALRHKGFIPWDDDTDVWMPRKDFLKFEKIARQVLPDDVYIENRNRNHRLENLVLHMRDAYSFAMIRATKRILLNDHQGICLDIFMVDEASGNSHFCRQLRRYHDGFIWRSLRSDFGRVRLSSLLYKWLAYCGRFATGLVWRLHQLVFRSNDWLVRFGCQDEWFLRSEFYGDTGNEFRTASFEGYDYFIPVKAEDVLNRYYGDWKDLPPEDKRLPCYEYKMPMSPCFHPDALDYGIVKATGSVSGARSTKHYMGNAKLDID